MAEYIELNTLDGIKDDIETEVSSKHLEMVYTFNDKDSCADFFKGFMSTNQYNQPDLIGDLWKIENRDKTNDELILAMRDNLLILDDGCDKLYVFCAWNDQIEKVKNIIYEPFIDREK